jgi:NitT/TauT family transport system substrate-binding protein
MHALRRTLHYLVLFVIGVALAGCGAAGPGAATEDQSVRVCYSALTATQIPLLYAYDQGFFEAEGLSIELTYFESGTAAATAMIADEIDICQIAGSAVVNAGVAGEDLVFLAGLFNTYVYSVLVTPDITGPQDLIGRSMAVSRIGSSSDAALRIALRSMGLTPDEDVAILAIGDQSARVAAMETGEIAGTVASIPDSTRAQQAGLVELLDMSTLNAPFQHTAIATSRQFISDRRATTVAFMRAMLAAIESMKQDRAATMEVMAEYLSLDPEADAELLAAAYDDLVPTYLADIPYPTLDGIQTLLDELEAENPSAADYQPEDLIDLSVLQEAASGTVGD